MMLNPTVGEIAAMAIRADVRENPTRVLLDIKRDPKGWADSYIQTGQWGVRTMAEYPDKDKDLGWELVSRTALDLGWEEDAEEMRQRTKDYLAMITGGGDEITFLNRRMAGLGIQ